MKETYDGAEARLWDLNERSTCLQKVVELWKFEATNAAAQQKRIKEELREEKRVRLHCVRIYTTAGHNYKRLKVLVRNHFAV